MAHYDFHGLAVALVAPPALDPVVQEAEHLWRFHHAPPRPRADIRIDFHLPPDWRPFTLFSRRPPEIRFGELGWYYENGAFVLTQPGVVVVGRGDKLDVYLESALACPPRRLVQHAVQHALLEALRRRGLFYVHAACVRSPGGARLVLPGDAGAGKSTMASALALGGFDFLSDDALFVDQRGDRPRIVPYRKHVHMPDDLRRRLVPGAAGAWLGEKWAFDPDRLFPRRRLRAIDRADVLVFPAITGEAASRLEPLAPAAALTALFAASTHVFFDRALAARHLEALRSLVAGARTVRFAAGRDVVADPSRYAALLGEGACAASALN